MYSSLARIMDNYRQIPGQDYGILRKKECKEEELFVFGYSCKVYEDYDKSLYVDQGDHLIPWLGDDSLKIDRYDCRGVLHDLTPYLPKSEGFNRLVGLSNEERRIESLCDDERYRAITTNEDEELLYHEEEMKRLKNALNNERHSEVAFNYEEDRKVASETSVTKESAHEEEENEKEPFIPHYQLDIPVGMKIPKSRKHHEIIEKTANFINDQGTQMEILLKMKQAENPQFNFLSFDDELHPYYRHLMNAIKSGRYKQTTTADCDKSPDTSQSDSYSDDTYLHPSLLSSSSISRPQPAPEIPTISYKPSEDCTYSALVNRIKEKQIAVQCSLAKGSSNLNYRTNDSGFASQSPDISNDALPLSALTKSARRRRIRKEKEKSKAAIASFNIYYSDEQTTNSKESKDITEISHNSNVISTQETKVTNSVVSPIPVLAPAPAPIHVLQLPPPDVQLIVDKMAAYVAKNGRDFEEVVKNKSDPRFAFLENNHVYNAFYNQKVELYLQLEHLELAKPKQSEIVQHTKTQIDISTIPSRTKSQKVTTKLSKSGKPVPICFSIKKSKDTDGFDIKGPFPDEENECEEVEDIKTSVEPCSEGCDNTNDGSLIIDPSEITSPKRENTDGPSIQKPELNLEKWAQDRLQAKLVAAVKEKMMAVKEKERSLQIERRRRAAEFINLLQKDALTSNLQTPESPNNKPRTLEIGAPTETNNGKQVTSDVITIPSETSSDSDSIVSVPVCASAGDRNKSSKKRERSRSPVMYRDFLTSRDYHRKKHGKAKQHRSCSSRGSRSKSHSRNSSRNKYKKNAKDKSRSKKKHHRYEDFKESRRSSRRSKKSKYSRGSRKRSASSDSSSDSETTSRIS